MLGESITYRLSYVLGNEHVVGLSAVEVVVVRSIRFQSSWR